MTIETKVCQYEVGGRHYEPLKVRHVVLEIRKSKEKNSPLRTSRKKAPGKPFTLAQLN